MLMGIGILWLWVAPAGRSGLLLIYLTNFVRTTPVEYCIRNFLDGLSPSGFHLRHPDELAVAEKLDMRLERGG